MKWRIQLIFECIWTAIIMFTMPFCLGIIALIIWVILAIPPAVALCKKIAHVNKKYLFFMGAVMLLLFTGGICFMGGWYEFIRCFDVV